MSANQKHLATRINTSCPYCGVGCGVSVEIDQAKPIKISGDKSHPANAGKLCSKGLALAETLRLTDRLLHPSIEGNPSDWETSTQLIANKLQQTISTYGPDAVAFYVSGQLLTEDYYVANKLMKGYVGSANIDTNSRLCMASSVAGHKRAFGSDTVPGQYSDIEHADLLVLVGSNLAWCHPILQQRITNAQIQNPNLKVVVIDPRRTATAELADLHLAVKPGGDAALFTGLLAHLADEEVVDYDYVEQHTSGIEDALISAFSLSFAELELASGLDKNTLNNFYHLFAKTPKTVTVYSQGVNQSVIGTDTVNSIINCHLATGRIGVPGMGPFSVTGQPNAMGGREVGGLSNMLAAHMDLHNPEHRHTVQEFWQSPAIADKPGLKAVDLFQAVYDGKVKFIWIMATNPVVSMPDANLVKAALDRCPFVVVSDVVANNETMAFANVKLPAAAWGEKNGTVTNSERCISRQRAFRALPAQVKPDWWAISAVAKKLGYVKAFDYHNAAEIFREHAALSAYKNTDTRDFDIGACASFTNDDYDNLIPFTWPRPKGGKNIESRFFANGNFYTANKRAQFIPIHVATANAQPNNYLLMANTGRLRDQWHTMTRTGRIATLSAHSTEPSIELNLSDAEDNGIVHGDIVRAYVGHTSILVRALVSDSQSRGHVFIPMHWNNSHASLARVNSLVPANTDPVSGQPALKSALISVKRYAASSYVFAVIQDHDIAESVINHLQSAFQNSDFYFARSPCENGWRYEIASKQTSKKTIELWQHALRKLPHQQVELQDKNAGIYRLSCFKEGNLIAAVFVSSTIINHSKQWIADQLGKTTSPDSRFRLLAGMPNKDLPDKGTIVCSCYMVGVNQIKEGISGKNCKSINAIGELTQAGTNCGSCRGELQLLLNAQQAELLTA